jgi:hypothetical protein
MPPLKAVVANGKGGVYLSIQTCDDLRRMIRGATGVESSSRWRSLLLIHEPL